MEVTWQAPKAAGGQEGGVPEGEASAGLVQRYVLEVHLRRCSSPRGAASSRAYTPRFPKVSMLVHFQHPRCARLVHESIGPSGSVSVSLPAGLCRNLGANWYSMGTQMEMGLRNGTCLTWLACGIICRPIQEAPGTDCGKALDR